jgi:hypothetical protein
MYGLGAQESPVMGERFSVKIEYYRRQKVADGSVSLGCGEKRGMDDPTEEG